MGNQTPETIRAAAYLATRERLDARKTTRNVQCNPPNIRCGNRCIPPTWDCRLKGQGTDPHLRAVKTDPLGGLANIQRGFGRISRGIVKGNFSEVEGGKAAIIRGTVKIAPGNIQQKNELKKKLEDRTAAIGIGLAAVTGGLGLHALLMKSNTFGYRDGLGNDINSATRAGVSRVLDALPLLGAQRARTRGAVAGAVGEAATRAVAEQAAGPATLRATLGAGGEAVLASTPIASQNVAAAGKLTTDLNRVDREFASGSGNFYAWNQRHREAFWNSSAQEAGVGGSRDARFSIFARPAAEEHLSRQFNLTGDERLTTRSIKDALTARIETERGDLIALAKQQGYRVSRVGGREAINESDLGPFMRGVVRTAGGSTGFTPAIRREVESHLEGVLTKSPATYTNTLYSRTVQGFNDFYREVGDIARNTAGASSLDPALRQRGYGEILGAADQTRARYLAGRMRMARPIAGQAHAELVGNAYFATRVAGRTNSTYSVTDRLAVSAASELAGRDVTSPTEAFRLLTSEYGFTGATRVRASRATAPRTTPAPTGQTRSARRRLRSRAEIIAMLTRGSNPMSQKAAAAEADRIIASRGDAGDFSPELVRTATYLAARADFQEGKRLGKPCGASHIPKAHECRKGQGAPTKASTPESGKKIRNRAAIAAAVGVGTALTAGGALAYKNREIVVPEISKRVIKNLSRTEVDAGINRIPKQFQKSARELVGGAKTSAAYMALKSKGGEVVSVNTKDNFTNWKMKDGTLLSTGSVGETLLIYSTKPQRSIGGAQTYSTQFRVDGEFDAKSVSASRNARGVASTVKKMFQAQVDQLPNNSIIYAIPYSNDDKGKKRRSIYEKYGFRSVLSSDERLFAMKRGGSFTRMQDSHIEQIADLIRNDRVDAAGKPCGASHIPKKHTCTKAQGAVAASPSTDIKRKAALAAAVVGGALAIGTAGSVAYNLKTLSDPTKSPLDPSPSIKDLVKSMKQEAGTKSASEAMGHYYTKKSGLKPGDVVYYRHEKDPAAHFGIYLGEGKDGIVRAVIANNNKSRFSWTDVAEIGATKPGIKTSQALMPPLVKAPAPKFKQSAGSFSNDEVVRRAIRIANTDYKFSLTKDNCEALANGIAYGVPESEQLQRFRRATRAVVDVGVSRGQRREAREAIYQGRAQGRSYTAREFVTFLEGQREFSSPAGKELAKQYAQYFQNSRLDASTASNGLISPDELWSRIKSYGPALKAQAMADYLLIQRSLLEMQRGPA